MWGGTGENSIFVTAPNSLIWKAGWKKKHRLSSKPVWINGEKLIRYVDQIKLLRYTLRHINKQKKKLADFVIFPVERVLCYFLSKFWIGLNSGGFKRSHLRYEHWFSADSRFTLGTCNITTFIRTSQWIPARCKYFVLQAWTAALFRLRIYECKCWIIHLYYISFSV